MTSHPLSLEEVAELARKTLENSIRLLDEAEALLYLGHAPTAMSLGVLAAEEFGKHMMCFMGAAKAGGDPDYWEDFWQRFRKHTPKYENAVSMALSFLSDEKSRRELGAQFKRIVTTDQARKMAGFYVDVVDSEIRAPWESISEEDASGALYVFHNVIRPWSNAWHETDFLEVFKEGLEAGGYDLADALEREDFERVDGLFRGLRESQGRD